jgi:hypothetical protein
MNNGLYSPLYEQIFEVWDMIAEDSLREGITQKVKTYIPEITLENIVFTFDETSYVLTVKIVYTINTLGTTQDSVEIDISLQQNAV